MNPKSTNRSRITTSENRTHRRKPNFGALVGAPHHAKSLCAANSVREPVPTCRSPVFIAQPTITNISVRSPYHLLWHPCPSAIHLRLKTMRFPGKYARHIKTALGGSLHLQKMPCFHDPFARKTGLGGQKINYVSAPTPGTSKTFSLPHFRPVSRSRAGNTNRLPNRPPSIVRLVSTPK